MRPKLLGPCLCALASACSGTSHPADSGPVMDVTGIDALDTLDVSDAAEAGPPLDASDTSPTDSPLDIGADVPTLSSDSTIAVSTASPRALTGRFSGFNEADIRYAVSYRDPRYQAQIALLQPGWLRFPGGTASDAFEWSTGTEPLSMVNDPAFPMGAAQNVSQTRQMLLGKGPALFADFVALTTNVHCGIIVCLNTFTDSVASARAFAQYVHDQHIDVALWELGNEPEFFTTTEMGTVPHPFYPDPDGALAYAAAVAPYAREILAVDPGANISVSPVYYPPNSPTRTSWDNDLGGYSPHFWNSVTVHAYPPVDSSTHASLLASLAGDLTEQTDRYVNSYLPRVGFGSDKVFVTEMNAGFNNDTAGTVFAGLWVAEYTMRMATIDAVKRVGMHAVYGSAASALQSVNDHTADVLAAADAGHPIDTTTLDFGFYPSAQGLALSVLNAAINPAATVLHATVTGPGTVATLSDDAVPVSGTMPALYAGAYAQSGGAVTVVVTNKSAVSHAVAITVDGRSVDGPFTTATVSSTDPFAHNTDTTRPINVVAGASRGAVSVPAYSITRITWGP